jgi:hypothetical protein
MIDFVKWFGETVGRHVCVGDVIDGGIFVVVLLSDVFVGDIDVFCSLMMSRILDKLYGWEIVRV